MGEDPVSICRQSQGNVTWVLEIHGGRVDWFTVNSDGSTSQCLVVFSIEDIPKRPGDVLVLTPILHDRRHVRATEICDKAGDQRNVRKLCS